LRFFCASGHQFAQNLERVSNRRPAEEKIPSSPRTPHSSIRFDRSEPPPRHLKNKAPAAERSGR
jgi:hypothetical protein